MIASLASRCDESKSLNPFQIYHTATPKTRSTGRCSHRSSSTSPVRKCCPASPPARCPALGVGRAHRSRPFDPGPDRDGRGQFHSLCIRGDGRAHILSAHGARIRKRACHQFWRRAALRFSALGGPHAQQLCFRRRKPPIEHQSGARGVARSLPECSSNTEEPAAHSDAGRRRILAASTEASGNGPLALPHSDAPA